MSAQHTPDTSGFRVKRNWSGPGFVFVDGTKVLAIRDTKRAAIQAMRAAIAKATGGAA